MKPYPSILLTCLIFLGFLVPAVPVFAAPPMQQETYSVVLTLDSSGSMSDTDSGNLRYTAAELFISLLDDGDRVGLITFTDKPQRLTSGLVPLNSPADKVALLEQIEPLPADGYTDIRGALIDSIAMLRENGAIDGTIILLSDGEPQLPDGIPADYEEQALELIRQSGARVIGIALTPEGESRLLYRLAAESGGVVISARDASGLLDAFLEALANLKDRAVLSAGDPAAPQQVAVPLDPGLAPYVSRVTFVVARGAGVQAALRSPGGDRLTADDARLAFAYDQDPAFAVFTVDHPSPGDWAVILSGSGPSQVRIIVRSRLRAEILHPASYEAQGLPMPVQVKMLEEQLNGQVTTLIGEASFTAQITRPDGRQESLDRLFDDGTHGDARANDGIFTNQYVNTDLVGEYPVQVYGWKGMIPVRQTRRVQVVPFPQVVVQSPANGRIDLRGSPLVLAISLTGGQPNQLDQGGFLAQIIDPFGQQVEVMLVEADRVYRAEWMPETDGAYQIRFVPLDARYKGAPYELKGEAQVEIRYVPAVSVRAQEPNLGFVPKRQLEEGLLVPLHLYSTSRVEEEVRVDLIGLPGVEIEAITPSSLQPGNTTLNLTLKGQLQTGDYTGKLVISAREGLDLLNAEQALAFTLIQPALTVDPMQIQALSIPSRRLARGTELEIQITSTSPEEESLLLTWASDAPIQIESKHVIVPAGETVRVSLPVEFGSLSAGSYTGTLTLTGDRFVDLQPGEIPVAFTITPPSFWQLYGLPLGIGLIGMFAGIVIAAQAVAHRPRPSGRLVVLQQPAGANLPKEIYLRTLSDALTGAVDIQAGGRVPIQGNARVRIKAQKQLTHKVIARKTTAVQETVTLIENLAEQTVLVNGTPVPKGSTSGKLAAGQKVKIGEYVFEYRV
jgi:hypothetical protein